MEFYRRADSRKFGRETKGSGFLHREGAPEVPERTVNVDGPDAENVECRRSSCRQLAWYNAPRAILDRDPGH